jgi:molybdate transport system ATP-binding protein
MLSIDIKKELNSTSQNISLHVALEIKQHEFVAISGKSGSGKTTLLRIIAGLEDAQGLIKVDGKLWQDNNKKLQVQKREVGFVFQDYALFENMSVLDNLLFVNKDKDLALHLLELTELSELKNRLPHKLSGGQKQRVSLCRAFMRRPKLLLMDEPLSALDPSMRMKLQSDILKLHKEFKSTVLMVSHDPSEIYKLASRVVVLDDGKIIQDGDVKDILLQTKGSQKFSLNGEILDIIKADIIYIAVVAIGQQIVEVVLDKDEAENFTIGEMVQVSTKAFAPTLSSLNT